MKYLFLATLLLSPIAFAQSVSCPQHFVGGAAPDLINQKLAPQTHLLCFEGYALLHSGLSRTPLWSAEHLTRQSMVQADIIKRKNSFHAESQLSASERSELDDYVRSGFDRGHMTPAGDMPTMSAQDESFSMANMVPQNPRNNQVLWSGLESSMRDWASSNGELYVITGPIFEGKIQRLNNRVFIPSGVFKAVYDPVKKQGAAYVAPNDASLSYQVVPLATLEQRIGINLFPKVPAAIKQKAMPLPQPSK